MNTQSEKFENKNLRIGCVIMASGLSRRFGRNKLLEKFQGKTLTQRVLDLTNMEWFSRRVVLTRCEEVADICRQQGVPVILHTEPDRNDAVRLGIREMDDLDGCVFCPCDQPLLTAKSLEKLCKCFVEHGSGIVRLVYNETPGTPILFGREYFQELKVLPPKCGGSYLVKKYPDQTKGIEAGNEMELFDIDTEQDLKWLKNYFDKMRK